MSQRVAVYFPEYNPIHERILRAFAAGIPGAILKSIEEFEPGDADIGVIFGWYKYAFDKAMTKKPVIDYYRSLGDRSLIVVEDGFQLRGEYYQAGWGGFAGNADFRAAGMPSDRWEKLGLEARPWKTDGDCLVIGQLPRDTQVQDTDHNLWCRETVKECRRIFKSVRFRPHPKVKYPADYGVDAEMDGADLADSLARAGRVITWNSTTGVDAILAGVPAVAMDKGSMAWPVASHDLASARRTPDRQPWLNGLAYSQWTPDEMAAGETWSHLAR